MNIAPTWRDTGWRAKRAEELAVVAMTAWFARVFIDPRRYVTGFDTVAYSAPNLRFTLTELTSGRIPLWNDTIFGGAPHLGNTQTGSLYLPKLLVVGLAVMATVSATLATGARTALFELAFNHLPGFDLMRVSARWRGCAVSFQGFE